MNWIGSTVNTQSSERERCSTLSSSQLIEGTVMRLQVFRLRELMSKFESQKQSSKKYNHTRFGENSWGYIETREDGSVWELLISCLLTDFRTWLFHRRWWLKKGVAEQILIKGRRNSKQTWSGNPWNANSSSLGRVLLSQTHLTHFKFWLLWRTDE